MAYEMYRVVETHFAMVFCILVYNLSELAFIRSRLLPGPIPKG